MVIRFLQESFLCKYELAPFWCLDIFKECVFLLIYYVGGPYLLDTWNVSGHLDPHPGVDMPGYMWTESKDPVKKDNDFFFTKNIIKISYGYKKYTTNT